MEINGMEVKGMEADGRTADYMDKMETVIDLITGDVNSEFKYAVVGLWRSSMSIKLGMDKAVVIDGEASHLFLLNKDKAGAISYVSNVELGSSIYDIEEGYTDVKPGIWYRPGLGDYDFTFIFQPYRGGLKL